MRKLLLILIFPSVVYSATITCYVNTGSTAGGDGTTNATAGDNRAYASMREMEAARQQDLTDNGGDILQVYYSGASSDTAYCDYAGWTTSTTNYIDNIGDATSGIWDLTKYKMNVNDAYAIRHLGNIDIRFTNMQIGSSFSGAGHVINMGNASPVTATLKIDRCIIAYLIPNANECKVLKIFRISSSEIKNSILYAKGQGASWSCGIEGYQSNTLIYNVTVSSCYRGIYCESLGTIRVKNCISYNNIIDYISEGGFDNGSTNNLSKDDTAPGFNSYYPNRTITFVNAAAGDFHLASTDTNAIDKGADLSSVFTTDIDGVTRTGTWDIGADEYVSAEPPAALVPMLPQVLIWEN